jgi:hypothetical protein
MDAMLKRVDGLIGLPDEAMCHAEKRGRDQLAMLIIEENQQGYSGWLCAAGCPKNEWERAMIGTINRILPEQRPSAGLIPTTSSDIAQSMKKFFSKPPSRTTNTGKKTMG